jgi:hypothetical protein
MMNWHSPYLWFGVYIVLIYLPSMIFIFGSKGYVKFKKSLWPLSVILLGIVFWTFVYYCNFQDRNLWASLIVA